MKSITEISNEFEASYQAWTEGTKAAEDEIKAIEESKKAAVVSLNKAIDDGDEKAYSKCKAEITRLDMKLDFCHAKKKRQPDSCITEEAHAEYISSLRTAANDLKTNTFENIRDKWAEIVAIYSNYRMKCREYNALAERIDRSQPDIDKRLLHNTALLSSGNDRDFEHAREAMRNWMQ